MADLRTIHSTPRPDCPACEAKRRHTPEDWRHHTQAGTGHYDAAGQPKEAVNG